MKVSQKNKVPQKNGIQQSHFWVYIQRKGNKITILKRYLHLHVHAALLTTAKIQQQPKCPSMDK